MCLNIKCLILKNVCTVQCKKTPDFSSSSKCADWLNPKHQVTLCKIYTLFKASLIDTDYTCFILTLDIFLSVGVAGTVVCSMIKQRRFHMRKLCAAFMFHFCQNTPKNCYFFVKSFVIIIAVLSKY